jgi:hypothetical protein
VAKDGRHGKHKHEPPAHRRHAAISGLDPGQQQIAGYKEDNGDIAARIDAIIADDDMYETGEPRPTPQAAAKAKDLINSGRALSGLPHSYFGEIKVTWKVRNRLLRLIVFSDAPGPQFFTRKPTKANPRRAVNP